MSTVADVLTTMSALDNELDIGAGGDDEASSIARINVAKRYFEGVAKSMPKVLSSAFLNGALQTIAGTANVEYTARPAALLRLDSLWMLDTTAPNLPLYEMEPIKKAGGHRPGLPWPLNYVLATTPGRPGNYYLDSANFFWEPIPDVNYTFRPYGLWSQNAFVARADPWSFPDSLIDPIAAFAVKYGLLAVGDDTSDTQKLAIEMFTPVLRGLREDDRSSPTPRHYQYGHTT